VEHAGTAADPSLSSSRTGTTNHGVSSHVSDDVYPGAAVHGAGIFMRGCFL